MLKKTLTFIVKIEALSIILCDFKNGSEFFVEETFETSSRAQVLANSL